MYSIIYMKPLMLILLIVLSLSFVTAFASDELEVCRKIIRQIHSNQVYEKHISLNRSDFVVQASEVQKILNDRKKEYETEVIIRKYKGEILNKITVAGEFLGVDFKQMEDKKGGLIDTQLLVVTHINGYSKVSVFSHARISSLTETEFQKNIHLDGPIDFVQLPLIDFSPYVLAVSKENGIVNVIDTNSNQVFRLPLVREARVQIADHQYFRLVSEGKNMTVEMVFSNEKGIKIFEIPN